MKAIVLSVACCLMLGATQVQAQSAAPESQRARFEQREKPSAEQRAAMHRDRMKKELSLDDKQAQAVYDFYLKQAETFDKQAEQARSDADARREQMKDAYTKQRTTMKSILSEEQFAKWERIQNEQARRMRQSWGDRHDPHRGPAAGEYCAPHRPADCGCSHVRPRRPASGCCHVR